MAMAELVVHEIEDSLSHFPPAPPPSPEAQRTRNTFFEIPASAFGPLDLRRQDFASLDLILSETQPSAKSCSPLSPVPERGIPLEVSFNEEDEFGFPASPKKRICNSPCSFPEGYDIDNDESHSGAVFNHSVFSSVARSKSTRHHRSPVHSYSPPHLAVSNSHSPPLTQGQSLQQTSPYSIPSKTENGFRTNDFLPANSPNPTYSPPHAQLNALSKSFDLHDVCPFQMSSDPIFPEVRARRAHTLDTTKLEIESSQQRRRKISLKRTNQERDSDLQFSFEYSYASTTSSEESDWLVVTQDTTTNFPQGKKPCQNHTPSLPLAPTNTHFTESPLGGTLPPRPPPSVSSIFTQVTPSALHTPSPLTEQPPSLMSMDSVQMMDTGETSLRLDSFDSMECGGEQLLSYTEMDTQYTSTQAPHLHTPHLTLSPPFVPLRSHSSEERYTSSNRHSFVQNFKGGSEENTNSLSRSV